MMTNLIKIFDADLEALIQMKGSTFESDEAKYYHSVLISYLTGNTQELTQLVKGGEIGLDYHY